MALCELPVDRFHALGDCVLSVGGRRGDNWQNITQEIELNWEWTNQNIFSKELGRIPNLPLIR